MKKIFLFQFLIALTYQMALSQPQKFNYQAVIRNAAGSLVPLGSTVSLRMSILEGSASGNIVYSEVHSATVNNSLGHINLQIGSGTVVTGTFNTINWSSGDKFLKTEVDPSGGSVFTDLGATQLLSVPYSLYADKANNAATSTTAASANTASNLSISGMNGSYLKNNGTTWIADTFPFKKNSNLSISPLDSIRGINISYGTNKLQLNRNFYEGSNVNTDFAGFGRSLITAEITSTEFYNAAIIGCNKDRGIGVLGISSDGTGVAAYSRNGEGLNVSSQNGNAIYSRSNSKWGLTAIGRYGASIQSFNYDSVGLELGGQLKALGTGSNRFAYQIPFQGSSFSSLALLHNIQKTSDMIQITPIYNGANNTIPSFYLLWNSGISKWEIRAASDDGTPSSFPAGCGFNVLVIRQ